MDSNDTRARRWMWRSAGPRRDARERHEVSIQTPWRASTDPPWLGVSMKSLANHPFHITSQSHRSCCYVMRARPVYKRHSLTISVLGFDAYVRRPNPDPALRPPSKRLASVSRATVSSRVFHLKSFSLEELMRMQEKASCHRSARPHMGPLCLRLLLPKECLQQQLARARQATTTRA